jgi:transposase-like protein
MSKGKRYTREFKLGAARLVVCEGYTLAEAAERLGTSSWSIRQWIRKFRETGQLPPAEEPQPVAEEVRRLRRELKRVQLENEILKKATAYFARDHL